MSMDAVSARMSEGKALWGRTLETVSHILYVGTQGWHCQFCEAKDAQIQTPSDFMPSSTATGTQLVMMLVHGIYPQTSST